MYYVVKQQGNGIKSPTKLHQTSRAPGVVEYRFSQLVKDHGHIKGGEKMIINILQLIDLVMDAIKAGYQPELLINGEYYTISK